MNIIIFAEKLFVLIMISLFISCGGSYHKNEEIIKSEQNENTKDMKAFPTIFQEPIDTTIIRSFIIDPFSNEQIIVKYHLKVDDWMRPVDWTLDFSLDDKDSFYKKVSNDAYIDTAFFNIGGSDGNPVDLKWKKDWYLNEILDFKFDLISLDDERRDRLKKISKNIAINNYKEYGSTEDEAIANWESLWSYYVDKEIKAIYLLLAPEGNTTPLMFFHPVIKKFVPVYSP